MEQWNAKWKSRQTGKPSSKLVNEVWGAISDDVNSLSVAESSKYLENYLWPLFHRDVSETFLNSILIVSLYKYNRGIDDWKIVLEDQDKFKHLIARVLQMCVYSQTSLNDRCYSIQFLGVLTQNIRNPVVKSELGTLLNIATWYNLEYKTQLLEQHDLGSFYFKQIDLLDKKKGEDSVLANLKRDFIHELIKDLMRQMLNELQKGKFEDDFLKYIETVLRFVTDCISQLPSRYFINTVVKESAIITFFENFDIQNLKNTEKVVMLVEQLKEYAYYPIDDFTGELKTWDSILEARDVALYDLQKILFKSYNHNKELAKFSMMSSNLINEKVLKEVLLKLSLEDAKKLAKSMYLSIPEEIGSRQFIAEALISRILSPSSLMEKYENVHVYPTEETLFDKRASISNLSILDPSPFPKISCMYLSFDDFLKRNFCLFRFQVFNQLSSEIQETIQRLKVSETESHLKYNKSCKQAREIQLLTIHEAKTTSLTSKLPAVIKAEIHIDFFKASSDVGKEWDSISEGDTVFLVRLEKQSDSNKDTVVRYFRCAQVSSVTDFNGNKIKDHNKHKKRRLLVNIDAQHYNKDKEGVYKNMNFIIKSKSKVDYMKLLLTMKELITNQNECLSDSPQWFRSSFLGDIEKAARKHNNVNDLIFDSTFQSWYHLVQSFPHNNVTVEDENSLSKKRKLETKKTEIRTSPPPYQLTFSSESDAIKVHSFEDSFFLPMVNFYPKQIESIISGSNTGISVITGAPGTGKSSVNAQIIYSLLKNFPHEKTLLVTHSEEELDAVLSNLFDIKDELKKDVVRLSGEDDAIGKVTNVYNQIPKLLQDVRTLASSLDLGEAHGESCENANYFFDSHVAYKWGEFLLKLKSNKSSVFIVENFPFKKFLEIQKFSAKLDVQQEFTINLKVAISSYSHIVNLFDQVRSLRPLELLKVEKERIDCMMRVQAKVVALTSNNTYMKREQFLKLGLNFDNIIISEAARLTELESILPLTMQQSSKDLKRYILIGDTKELGPTVSKQLGDVSRMGQSLLARLISCGISTLSLDQQGRSRPEFVKLYEHQYDFPITSLPHTFDARYNLANAGFFRTHQFINVDFEDGEGEIMPSPGIYQNIREAEYSVALFSFMRLLGYPAEKITILTPYIGQKILIEEILGRRCGIDKPDDSPDSFKFGWPKVSLIENYQSQTNDYVILSLVRTVLSDISPSRLTVAFSRARLGFYIFGCWDLFKSENSNVYKFFQPFDSTNADSTVNDKNLQLVLGEMFNRCSRKITDGAKTFEIANLEHFGQYVYEMTKSRLSIQS